jgi:sterol desaturase/sphingolipid hydroxylase (fatty acid hydroxylase superfamily)
MGTDATLETVETVAGPTSPTSRSEHPVTGRGILLSAIAFGLFVVALVIRSDLALGLVVLAAIFLPAERFLAVRRHRVFRQHWSSDLVHFVFNNLVSVVGVVAVVVLVGLVPRLLVPDSVRAVIGGQPWWLQFAEALAIVEVCGYWAHRANHTIPFLWRFHKVHHSIEEMDWLAAGRLHPLDQVFTRACIILPLFVLGFSRATFGAFLAFAGIQAIFIHANVRVSFGPLRYIVTTPEFHHWHHSNEPQARNANFAGELPVLDAIFGTLYLPSREPGGRPGSRFPARYGIDEPAPAGYLRQVAWSFREPSPRPADAELLAGRTDSSRERPVLA